jgi:aspartyl-tRNA(Asn)/glutamyl-tRNA(Gln) amidotransferase subunit C
LIYSGEIDKNKKECILEDTHQTKKATNPGREAAVKITKRDVVHVAGLARLRFSEDQLDLFTDQLNTILTDFDKLQQLDTSGVEPSTHAVSICNAFREDQRRPSLSGEESLENAPARERSCFKVPRIIEG